MFGNINNLLYLCIQKSKIIQYDQGNNREILS